MPVFLARYRRLIAYFFGEKGKKNFGDRVPLKILMRNHLKFQKPWTLTKNSRKDKVSQTCLSTEQLQYLLLAFATGDSLPVFLARYRRLIAYFFGPLQETHCLFLWPATGDSLPVFLAQHYLTPPLEEGKVKFRFKI